MKLGMNTLFAPGDLTWTSLWDRFRGRAKQREKEQAWNRRRSEQLAKENQERRQGRMNHGGNAATTGAPGGGGGGGGGGGMFRHGTNTSLLFGAGAMDSPSPTPATPAHAVVQSQQTGMLGIYQDMNAMAGTRRARTPEQVV